MKTQTETIEWHTDPTDLPKAKHLCLVITEGGSGPEGRASWNGSHWRLHDGFQMEKKWVKSWAYEPKGPKGK